MGIKLKVLTIFKRINASSTREVRVVYFVLGIFE